MQAACKHGATHTRPPRATCPQHNKTHAADVLQTLHVLLLQGGLVGSGYCDPLTHLACLLAAVSG